jgi:long-subunit acyl-CoA synthetase (AMP-forming)
MSRIADWARVGSCVSAPLNPAYSSGEVEFYLSDSGAKLFIVPQGAVKANSLAVQSAKKLGVSVAEVWWDAGTEEVALQVTWDSGKQAVGASVKGSGSPHEDDVALLLHTSGTTGRPKAVPLTHRNLVTTMRNITNTYRLKSSDRSFLVMPLVRCSLCDWPTKPTTLEISQLVWIVSRPRAPCRSPRAALLGRLHRDPAQVFRVNLLVGAVGLSV